MYATALNWLSSQTLCKRLRGGNYCNLETISSLDLIASLSQISIKGLTGDLGFNQTNPNRRRAYFDIFQYNYTAALAQVGFWNITGSYLSSSSLGWKILPKSEGGNGMSSQEISPVADPGENSSSFVPLSSNHANNVCSNRS